MGQDRYHMAFSTADISDTFPDRTAVCELQFRSFGMHACFCGPCVPLQALDHRPVKEALSQPGDGRVLVVDVQGHPRFGVFGDRLATLAVRNGWAGVVVHGLIRDSRLVNALDIGVKALGTTALRNPEAQPSAFGQPLSFGAVRFDASLWVYADADAVLVGPPGLLPLPADTPLIE